MSDNVSRVLVWPGLLRVIHWAAALAVVLLLLSGWLMKSGLVLNDRLYEFLLEQLHLPAGHVLGLAVVVRFYLLARDRGVEGYSALVPGRGAWQGIKEGLVFYTSFARTNPPRYFAHHPVWAPVYLLWWLLLAAQLVTGLLLEFGALRGLFGLSSDALLRWHLAPFGWLAMLAVLHVVSAFLDDLKGSGSDVSAMINGHRTFETGEKTGPAKVTAPPSVSLNDLGVRKPPKDGP
jgi:Ni,Fe-hydrogenase I cytochrome b subunit